MDNESLLKLAEDLEKFYNECLPLPYRKWIVSGEEVQAMKTVIELVKDCSGQ